MLKRKLQEEAAEAKKRQREEEEEKKKQERIDKRMAALNSQMDEKLFKESCMMREKHIMNLVRGLNKEFARRRKAVELMVGSNIDRSPSSSLAADSASTVLAPFSEMLPPLSRTYDAEIVRVWDFLHSFSEAFRTSLPSLDTLQDAFDCVKKSDESDRQSRSSAVKLFENIAIELIKVISPR